MKTSKAILSGLLGLAFITGTVGIPTEASAQGIEFAGDEDREIDKSDIDEDCENTLEPPQPGIQFDGSPAAPEVMQLTPGQYLHPGEAALVLYPDGRFFVRPPLREQEIAGRLTVVRGVTATDGPDSIFPESGLIGGCSREQLSEVIAKNNMTVGLLEPVDAYGNTLSYAKSKLDEFCDSATETPEPGIQFDGEPASSDIMQLEPGQYGFENGAFFILFPDKRFLLQVPVVNGSIQVSSTAGSDFMAGGLLGGCSAEQLSEAINANRDRLNTSIAEQEAAAGNRDGRYREADIDAFCEGIVSSPQPGIQFDGEEVLPAVLQLTPGRYEYPNGGGLMLFSTNHYLLQIPEETADIYGTAGGDLVANSIVGGCYVEQLSEAIARNELSIDLFELVSSYE